MELDAFTNRIGAGQGRLATEPDAFEFVLGDVEPGRFAQLVPGDRAGVAQGVDLTATDLIRLQGTLRVPSTLPPTLAWEVSIVVGEVPLARVRGTAGRTRVLADLTANVSSLSGVHSVEARLELVAV